MSAVEAVVGIASPGPSPSPSPSQVVSAVEAGFRLVDTAAHYPGESGVGDALAALEARGAVRPGEVQVCSKIWFDDMGYEPALSSARGSLERLRRERLDVLLIHFPGSPDARQDPKANPNPNPNPNPSPNPNPNSNPNPNPNPNPSPNPNSNPNPNPDPDPTPNQDPKANRLRRAETWRALETLQAQG
eukprot:scaffold124672_cov54-Phaeocystis_antarctica.AAC.1